LFVLETKIIQFSELSHLLLNKDLFNSNPVRLSGRFALSRLQRQASVAKAKRGVGG
jgi:hypothetical protein